MQAYPEVLDDPEGDCLCYYEINYTVINHVMFFKFIVVCFIDLLLYYYVLLHIIRFFSFTLIKLITQHNHCQLRQWTRQLQANAYPETCQTSKMECFAKTVNAFQLVLQTLHLRCLTTAIFLHLF